MIANWKALAVGSAFFAALTAIFGKLGVAEVSSELSVVFVLVLSVLILRERVGWRVALGGALIAVGAVIIAI
jgi:transporter family protein